MSNKLQVLKPVTAPKQSRKRRIGNGITITEAARQLNVHHSTMLKAIAAGEVNLSTFGGIRFVTPNEIERLKRLLAGEEDQP